LVLAKGYEKAFASHMETFSERRAELQTVISEYIAIGVSDIAEKVDVMDVKLDKIISVLFRNLDTPREAEVFKFLHDIGGPEKCINDPNLLQKLASKAGEPLKSGKAELEDLRKSLREALNEDLDKVLEKHYSRFEKALEVQSKNLQRITSDIEEQGPKLGKILETVTTIRVLEEGKYRMKEVRLKDPVRLRIATSTFWTFSIELMEILPQEIQDVWTRMVTRNYYFKIFNA
jgi:DNA-binding transcriptional regulator GbsR (MarR family)